MQELSNHSFRKLNFKEKCADFGNDVFLSFLHNANVRDSE